MTGLRATGSNPRRAPLFLLQAIPGGRILVTRDHGDFLASPSLLRPGSGTSRIVNAINAAYPGVRGRLAILS
jgi:hypothetical protein